MASASTNEQVTPGGSPVRVSVTDQPIDSAAMLADIGSHADGAVVLFEGRVRDATDGRSVVSLRYEAYREMAERELTAIANETAGRYGVSQIAVAHRTGELKPGEVSVSIVVASPHRDAGYVASREVIEEIKRRLPIWKEERFADGTAAWVEAPAGGTRGGDANPGDAGPR